LVQIEIIFKLSSQFITDLFRLGECLEDKDLEGYDDPDNEYMELIWPEKKNPQLYNLIAHSFLTDLLIIFFSFENFYF
jgi:hypothetical protein